MKQPEWNSQVWREHNERVKLIESARRAAEKKAGLKIGRAYVPPAHKVLPAVQLAKDEHQAPHWAIQVGIGILIAGVFLAFSYAF